MSATHERSKSMKHYRECPQCGAHLDFGEACDCQNKEKAPVSAANTDKGKAEKSNQTFSYNTRKKGDLSNDEA